MTEPRQVFKGDFHLITRRCTQRQFLLRPDDETNNAYVYCLAVAAQKYDIDIVNTIAEPNHHHTVVYDREGTYPRFMRHFHKLMASCQNARRGRWENFWSSEEPCVTKLLDREAVIARLVYVASNPVKDKLVERADQWPGVTGYKNLLSQRPLRAHRPNHYFRKTGRMPKSVTLALTIPEGLGSYDEVVAEVRAGVEAVERAVREDRQRTGARILGRANVLRQSWRDSPSSIEPRRNLRPRFAGGVENRIAALLSYRAFLIAYRHAREELLARRPAMFPPGTYWLARTAGVPVSDALPC